MDYGHIDIDKDIERKFLKHTDIDKKKSASYLVSAMGSGKTKAVVDYIEHNNPKSCVFINCRISLAQNIKGRLPENYISYDDTKSLGVLCESQGVKDLKNNVEIKRCGIPLANHLVITPYSVHYTDKKNYDLVIIDEFEIFQTAWISDKCHTTIGKNGKVNNFLKNWYRIIELLTNAKKVIIMDAIPSKNALFYLAGLGFVPKDIEIVGSSFKYPEQKVIEIDETNRFINKIIQTVADKDKVYIFWPYKNPIASDKPPLNRLSCSQLVDLIQKDSRIDRKLNYLIYTADTNVGIQKENLKNVNKEWEKKDLIIVNQSITVGINYDVPDNFHSIYLADANFISMRELVQTSRRIRKTKSNKIYYCNLGGKTRDTFFVGEKVDDKLLSSTCENIFNEYRARNKTTLRTMFEKNQMIFSTNEEKFAKLPKKYKENLSQDHYYEWNNIPTINDPEVYERLICSGAECLTDVLKIAKFQFYAMFKGDISEVALRDCWNNRGLVVKLYNYYRLDSLPEWSEEILKQLKPIYKTNVTISSKNKKDIFKKFSFLHNVSEKSSDKMIASRALNCYFCFNVYYYDSKKKNYCYNEEFHNYLEIAKRYMDHDKYEDDVCMFIDEEQNYTEEEIDNNPYF